MMENKKQVLIIFLEGISWLSKHASQSVEISCLINTRALSFAPHMSLTGVVSDLLGLCMVYLVLSVCACLEA